MKEKAQHFVDQFGLPPTAWTVEESDYATSIHVVLKNGRSMECHLESQELHNAVVALLKSIGADVKRLQDPRDPHRKSADA